MNDIQKAYDQLSQNQKDQFEKLSRLLITENLKCNLTRIVEPDQIMTKHFIDSLAAFDLMKAYEEKSGSMPFLIDIGSGAGFPVLPLAIAFPNWNFTSVEATGKKTDFQNLVVEQLGLDNIDIIQDRAEELATEEDYWQKFDFTVTRAVGKLEMIAELTVPFLRKGGKFLTWKGPRIAEEMPAGKRALEILGMGNIRDLPYQLPDQQQSECRLIEATKIKNTPSKYPREFKDIKKFPLGS
ncbi:MAG: 16S rRNA (guanine(527)-N(7))-methyltransferase RsmG [Sedimentisphaeraceae bacterium JB056]